MSDNTNEHRLPPPAFPPGQRRHAFRNSKPRKDVEPAETSSDVAIIGPDDPIPLRRDPIEQAFIDPDDPIPERKIELVPEFAELAPPSPEDGEGEVVGMDLAAHTDPIDAMTAVDRNIAEITVAIANLAGSLRRRGEAALRRTPEMTQFEATLRAYCVGYLAGRRAEEPPPPVELEEMY